MKLGILTALFDSKPLEEVADYVSGLGYEAVELTTWAGSGHFDLDQASKDPQYGRNLVKMLGSRGLTVSALSDHLSAQQVLPPNDASFDDWSPHTDKQQQYEYGREHLLRTARIASELEIPVVNGFFGSTVWGSWYTWPPKHLEIYNQGWDLFVERWNPILDEFKKLGVKFAHETHPTEIAYNITTAQIAVDKLNREDVYFNFDPSHFIWQQIDPVIFVKTFGKRIVHVHAKDFEVQEDEIRRDGVLSTGSWRNPRRAARYRVVGWGQVPWRRVITALLEVGYDYVLSYEHEDPVMSERDGAEKAIDYLRPLVVKEPMDPEAHHFWLV
jgi:sugar phosphate isomerase/epimerase